MSDPLRETAAAFFDAFVEAFETFDGATIAMRYLAPYVAMQADGTLVGFREHAEIVAYFQNVVDDYRAQGCRSCRYRDLEVVEVGGASLLATVTWELLHEDGHVQSAWRESYNLVRQGEGLRVFASTDHSVKEPGDS